MVERAANALLGFGSILAGGTIFLKSFFYTVDAGERAIIFDKMFGGLKDNVIGEGMHFYIPFI
jgi:prohibitin 1